MYFKLLVLLCFAIIPLFSYSHPHSFLDAEVVLTIEYDVVTLVKVDYNFDSITTSMVLNSAGINPGANMSSEQEVEVANILSRNLKSVDYFIVSKSDSGNNKIPVPELLVNYSNRRLKASLIFKVSWDFKNAPLMFGVADPTEYVGIDITSFTVKDSRGKNAINVTNTYESFGTYGLPYPVVKIEKGDGQVIDKKGLNVAMFSAIANSSKQVLEKLQIVFTSLEQSGWAKGGLLAALLLFLYGMLHAAGPGHGKVLVGALVISGGVSKKVAVLIGVLVSLGHGISGILVASVATFWLNIGTSAESSTINSSVLTRISGGGITLLGLVLFGIWLYENFKDFGESKGKNEELVLTAEPLISKVTVSAKKGRKEASLLTAFFISLIPCPGTVFIFVFASTVVSRYMAFVAAGIQIAGMVTLVGFVAFLVAFGRERLAEKMEFKGGKVLLELFEGGATLLIFSLGIILLMSSFA